MPDLAPYELPRPARPYSRFLRTRTVPGLELAAIMVLLGGLLREAGREGRRTARVVAASSVSSGRACCPSGPRAGPAPSARTPSRSGS